MKIKILTVLLLIILLSISLETVCANNQLTNFIESVKNQVKFQKDLIFDLKIKLLMRLGCFPSLSVCIVKNNSIVWYNGYGRAKFLTKPTINMVYPIGSISKTFVSTALMQLYEQGLFGLDDNVNDYLDFKVFNPKYPDVNVTFRMLLAHQSSLTGFSKISADLNVGFHFYRFMDEYPYPLVKRMIHPEGDLYFPTIWIDYPPGSEPYYSSLNFILLEHLTEVISNQPFIDYCEENIFTPLNMSNISFFFKDFKRSQLATTYHNIGNFYFRIPALDMPYGVGGIKCSIEDLSHYAIAHMNGGVYNGNRILNESTVELMHTIQFENDPDPGNEYGLGWINWEQIHGRNLHGHAGHVPGGTSTMWINESNDYAILLSTNRFIFFFASRAVKAWEGLIVVLTNKAKEF